MILHCFNPFALICKQTYEVEDFYRVEYEPDQIHNWTSLNLFNQMVSINHHLNLDWMELLPKLTWDPVLNSPTGLQRPTRTKSIKLMCWSGASGASVS